MDRPRLIASPAIDLSERSSFRLGKLQVEPSAREVFFDHRSMRLEPLVMKVLVALAARRGEVVTRYDLIDACWDGRIVGDDVVNRAILLLRRIAKASDAFSIETVRKSGYRLTEADARPMRMRRPTWLALVAILATAIAAMLLPERPDQSHPSTTVIELAPIAASGGSLAAETAQASDEAVADMLARSGLPVLKRPGAADLSLSGQVRDIGNKIEANLQLNDLRHGTLLLSRRFSVDRSEAPNLPDQMGAFAATALASTGAMMAVDRQRPGDRRLTGEVLRQWSTMLLFEDPVGSYRAVERIARGMPDSAVAQLALAMMTSHVLPLLAPEDRTAALAEGRAAGARARTLAPYYGDVAWPDCTLHSPARLTECESSLRKAYSVDPDAPFVAAGIRNELVSVGRYREALAYDRLAVAAMPYMAGRLSASSMLLEGVGLQASADQQFEKVRRLWPEFHQAFAHRMEGMLDRGSVEDAAKFVATMPRDVDVIDRTAVAEIAADVSAKRTQQLRNRCASPAIGDDLAYFCIVALARTGDLDVAFRIADRLYPQLVADDPLEEDRLFLADPASLGLGALSTPALAPLRADPRFIPIAERVGLIRYWRHSHLPDFCTQKRESVCSKL